MSDEETSAARSWAIHSNRRRASGESPAEPAQTLQIAYSMTERAFAGPIGEELARAGFRSPAAADLCRIGLCNYAAEHS